MREYTDQEIELINSYFANNEIKIKQVGYYDTEDKVEYDISPLVREYSIFLEDGKSLEELLDELVVTNQDVDYVLGGL